MFEKHVQKITADYMILNRQKKVLIVVFINAIHSYLCVLGTHRAKKLQIWVMGVKMRPLLRQVTKLVAKY